MRLRLQLLPHAPTSVVRATTSKVSLTVFLSSPESYDGGELVLEFTAREQDIKLPAGSAVLPGAGFTLVSPIASGQRLTAVTWVRNLVRDAAAREILFDLETARHGLPARFGKVPELDLLAKTQANLLRRWVED
jgi:PKHD-type hydroxylase